MTDPLLLPSGAVVEVVIPSPPSIVAPAPSPSVPLVVPVPGPPGPPGGGTFVLGEVPSGVQDGLNAVFTLAETPRTSSTAVYRNGLRERLGVGYTESGAQITFTTPPLPSDELSVDYLMEG